MRQRIQDPFLDAPIRPLGTGCRVPDYLQGETGQVKVFVEDKPEHAKVLETKTIREAVNVVLRTMGEKPKVGSKCQRMAELFEVRQNWRRTHANPRGGIVKRDPPPSHRALVHGERAYDRTKETPMSKTITVYTFDELSDEAKERAMRTLPEPTASTR